MADVSKNFAIRRFVPVAMGADNLPGVPIVCPIDCTQVVIENGDTANAQNVYTDPSGAYKVLPATVELTIRAFSHGGAVFQQGEVVCRVAPVAGAGPVIVSFIR
jgi:hypothetical protein